MTTTRKSSRFTLRSEDDRPAHHGRGRRGAAGKPPLASRLRSRVPVLSPRGPQEAVHRRGCCPSDRGHAMPWKLVPPREGKTPFWYVRGKYLGIALDRSTGTSERRAATTILGTWKRQAERGEYAKPDEAADPGSFLSAAK